MKRIRVILTSLVVFTLFAVPLLAKAYMGVYLGDLSKKDYEKFGLKENYGILIKKVVDESPADNAGLQSKDILLELAGDKVYTVDQLTKMLSYFEPEQKVKIKYFRDNKVKTLNLKLGEKKTFKPKKKAYLGVFLAELDNEIREKLELKEQHGILITKTVEDGPSEKAGIKSKTVFLKMDGEKIYTIDQLTKMLSSYKPEQEVKLYIYYKKDYKNVTVKLGEREDLMFKFGDVFDWNFLNKPDNVFVYQYDMENRKWIGAILKTNEKIIRDGDEETIEINITVDNVIEDTPADKAGLKEGDIVLEFQDKKILSPDGIPAVKIHNNIITQPLGQSLFIMALGPVSVIGNQLTSQGADFRINPRSLLAGAVFILNLGISKDLIATMFLSSFRYLPAVNIVAVKSGSAMMSSPGHVAAATVATDVSNVIQRILYFPNGNVLFANNH